MLLNEMMSQEVVWDCEALEVSMNSIDSICVLTIILSPIRK